MNIILEKENEISNNFNELMTKEGGAWIGRIGGSDYKEIIMFLNKLEIRNDNIHIKLLNGYFDKSSSPAEKKINFLKFITNIMDSYKNMDLATVATAEFIHILITNKMSIDGFPSKKICSYSFIEDIYPFLNSFKEWGENKKILIVSPFSKSIEYQSSKQRLPYLINNYQFPNCEFSTYQSLITYNAPFYDNSLVEKQTCGYNNFNDYVIKMCKDIASLNFDICFISAGSYSVMIGDYIKTTLNKKAIYIGGILNIFFNIYGERYHSENMIGLKINNMDYNIKSLEQDEILDYKNIEKLAQMNIKNEGFKAYFSSK